MEQRRNIISPKLAKDIYIEHDTIRVFNNTQSNLQIAVLKMSTKVY
jgi:hypothetical protein